MEPPSHDDVPRLNSCMCPVVRMRSDSIKWSSVNLLCMLQSVGWWGSKMKLDFSTAVRGKLHKFCWFLLGALYILLYAGHTPRVAMVKCVKTFLQPFSQKSVQLEDQLQRYNACFWRWKGEIEQNIYERKDKWKQKKCTFRLFGCKGSCGKRWPLPPRWLGHIPDQNGPWTILPQEGRRELVLSGKGVQERVEKDGLDLKIFSLKPLNFLEVWQFIGYF